MSVEEGIHLLSEVELPQCTCSHNGEKNKTKESEVMAIMKFIFGMVWAVMTRYWISSFFIVVIIISFSWLYGFWPSFAIFICSLFAIVYHISDQMVYWPGFPLDSRSIVNLPSTVGMPSENLYLYAKDGTKLHAVFIKQDEQALNCVPTIVYLHGNAGNLGHRLSNAYDLYRFLGVNILMVEYRGYGLSQGYPSEEGLYLDAQSAICYLRTRNDIDINKIVVFGRSLGGAVAVDSVSRSEIRSRIGGLVVENTFTSIPEMAKCLFSGIKVLSSLPSWCHKNKFSSRMKMCRVVVPTLFLSGQADTLVPPSMMVELYQSCAAPKKRLLQFPKGTHNETWRCKGYYQAFGNFLDEIFHHNVRLKPLPPGVISISEPQIL